MSEPKHTVEIIDNKVFKVTREQVSLDHIISEYERHAAANQRLGQENAKLRSENSALRFNSQRYETTNAALQKLKTFTIALGEGRVSMPGAADPASMTQGIVEALVNPEKYFGAGIPVDPLKRFGVQIAPAPTIPVGRATRTDA